MVPVNIFLPKGTIFQALKAMKPVFAKLAVSSRVAVGLPEKPLAISWYPKAKLAWLPFAVL